MRLGVMVLVVLVSGCAFTAEQRAAQAVARYGPECKALGFTPGTEAFASCVLQIRNERITAWGAITNMQRPTQ